MDKPKFWFPVIAALLFLLLVGVGVVYTKIRTPQKETVYIGYAKNDGTPVVKPDTPEVIVLKAQLQAMKDADERLLQTVYWSLAGVAGFTLFLCGYSWYHNRFESDREREVMKESLLQALRNDFESRFTSAGNDLSNRLEKSESKMLDQAAKTEANLSELVNKVSVDLDGKLNQFKQLASVTASSQEKSHSLTIDLLSKRIDDLELSGMSFDREIAALKDEFGDAVVTGTFELERLINTFGKDKEFAVKENRRIIDVLESLTFLYKKAGEQNAYIGSTISERLSKTVGKLPPLYSEKTQELIPLITSRINRVSKLLGWLGPKPSRGPDAKNEE